jgi:hypothetical protein
VILRRLYLYMVSAVALVVLSVGLTFLGATVLLFAFSDPAAESARSALAIFTAMSVVALPVWGVHFWFAQRFATRDPYERSSAIRHLYLYFASLVFSVAAMVGLAITLAQLLRPVLDSESLNGETTAQDAWATALFVGIFALHFYIASRDGALVREEGASATLRRWYMYVALIVGLLTMLSSTQQLLELAWTSLASKASAQPIFLDGPAGAALAGAVLWGLHARFIATRHASDDRHSTLRALEGFIAVAISIVTALYGASQILYYALARVLGVNNPGGATNDVLAAAASPVSLLLVYGIAWFLIRRRLARDGASQEAERQAGVRRLYTNLVSLISLAAWAYGAALLLGTLAQQLEASIIGVRSPDWKDPISLSVTLFIVGAAVWVTHWRQSPWAVDRQAFSRKLYVWAALLGSVLAVLGGGVNLVYVLLQQLFSTRPKLEDPANLGFASSLAVIVVAATVGLYHWRVLRADSAARPPKGVTPAASTVAVVATQASTQPAAPAAEVLGPYSRRYTLVVTEATDDDVHQALASLPPQASYRLTPTEQTVDGR